MSAGLDGDRKVPTEDESWSPKFRDFNAAFPMMSEPQRTFSPSWYANYPGDVRHMVGEVVGPNTMGERFRAVAAELVEGGGTRVRFEWAGHE